MIKRIFLCLLFLLACNPYNPPPAGAFGPAIQAVLSLSAGCTSVAVDHWQTFEAADFLSSPPTGWSITDTGSKLSLGTTGEQATISCPGGVTDTGTKALAFSMSGGAKAYAKYTITATAGYISFGFWYTTPDFSATTWKYVYVAEPVSTGGYIARIRYKKDGGNPYIDVNAGASTITVANATMYWITMKVKRNDASILSIYDTSGTLVGSIEFTARDVGDINGVQVGNSSNCSDIALSTYYDDFIIDTTDATFPLGP